MKGTHGPDGYPRFAALASEPGWTEMILGVGEHRYVLSATTADRMRDELIALRGLPSQTVVTGRDHVEGCLILDTNHIGPCKVMVSEAISNDDRYMIGRDGRPQRREAPNTCYQNTCEECVHVRTLGAEYGAPDPAPYAPRRKWCQRRRDVAPCCNYDVHHYTEHDRARAAQWHRGEQVGDINLAPSEMARVESPTFVKDR